MVPADFGSETFLLGVPSDEAEEPSLGPGWTDAGASEPEEEAVLALLLRPRPDTVTPAVDDLGGLSPRLRAHLSREQLGDVRGAHPDDVRYLVEWLTAAGVEVIALAPERRTVEIKGSLGRLSGLFGVEFRRAQGEAGEYRIAQGRIAIPEEFAPLVIAVLGLDTRPLAQPHFRPLPLPQPVESLAAAAPLSYPPTQVAELYGFPAGTSGSGECIGLIELGGGFRSPDVSTYFAGLGLPAPDLIAVPVAGGSNTATGDPGGPDGEVMLDIELSGSMAPGVRLAVYFAPNTDQGFLAAINAALHDEANRPSVLSISWGGPESAWTKATMTAFDQAFQDAALLGVSVCVAAGDSGSGDGVGDGQAHVDFPASSPHVLACGGTRTTSQDGTIQTEVAWNDGSGGGATGGGVSAIYASPSWQAKAHVPPSTDAGHKKGRGVPDVAGNADPETGYQVLVDGQKSVLGGTSAVAPLWAALLVRCAQALGHNPGFLNPILYQTLAAEGVTRDVTKGNNGAYKAGPGWDPCTGWGSPQGTRLLTGLRG
ncbi:MAG TPA: S53 family peptidase [Candidatus Dormibacteraeota bacterium]|nr:S53 family peptidase [Candidatus Dormibacteraeota bacterium]